jgi:hypothetical protein
LAQAVLGWAVRACGSAAAKGLEAKGLELAQLLGQLGVVVARRHASLLAILDTWQSKTFRGIGHLLMVVLSAQ